MQIEYAKELLRSARHRIDSGSTSRADQRRTISDAYYALFHLLVGEAAATLTNDDQIARHLARVPDHGSLKSICEKISKTKNVPIPKEFDVPNEIVVIAGRFVELYQARLDADYSLAQQRPHYPALHIGQAVVPPLELKR